MSKDSLRLFFVDLKGYICFKPFLEKADIKGSSFSRFLKGSEHNYEVSLPKLMLLKQYITDFCDRVG